MFICGVPRDSDEFSRVLRVEQSLFGDLSLPPAMAFEIFNTRPEIYTAILGPNDTVAAYSSAYPLKREWAEAFIAGDIAEPDLTPSMLLGRHDGLEGSCVYIGSVVVDRQYDPLMKATLLTSLLSWRVQQLKAASVKRLSVFMMPVAEQGERMIRFVGAKQMNDGTNRKDGYPVYGRVITPGFLCRATATLERCLNSRIVQMNLNFTPNVDHLQSIPSFDEAVVRKVGRQWVAAALNMLTYGTKAALSAFASLRDKVSSAFSSISGSINPHRIVGLGVPLTLVALATAALLTVDIYFEIEHLIFAYLFPIIFIAIRFGKVHAAIALAASVLSAAYFFYPPKFSIYIDDYLHVAELVFFCAIAFLICQFFGERPSRA